MYLNGLLGVQITKLCGYVYLGKVTLANNVKPSS